MCSAMCARPPRRPSARDPARTAIAMAVRGPGIGSKRTVSSPCRKRTGSRRRPITLELYSQSPRLGSVELVQEIAQDGEPAIPECRIIDREAQASEQHVGRLASSRGEEL